MNEATQTGIIIAITAAIVTSLLNYWVQTLISKSHARTEIRKERLTKLLLPLYVLLKREEVMWKTELAFTDGDPPGFIEDLPKYYQPLEKILMEYLYLADDELSKKSLDFISWVNVSRVDEGRWDKIMENRIKNEDVPLEKFKQCVFKKYEKDKSLYNS